jgi:transposase
MVASKKKVQPVKVCAWKQEMYAGIVSGDITVQDLIKTYGHSKSTAYDYRRKIRQGWEKEQVSRVGGRPRRLDGISCEELEQQVKKLETLKESPSDKEANKKGSMAALLKKALILQNKRRNKTDNTDVNKRQARNMAKHFKCGHHNATKMTNAHWVALHDARNAVSMQVAAQAIRHILGGDKHLLLNLDGTGFQHKGIDKDGKHTVVFCTHEHYNKIKQTGDELNTHVDDDPSDTGVFIKNLVLVNAFGEVAPTVTLIDDPKVAKGATEVYPINNFARDGSSTGWIAVNNGRNGTAEFYKRYYTEILIPFVANLRDKYVLGKEKPAVLWIDGEDIQMAPLLEKELRDLLREHHIHILKGPASTTPKTQLLDTSVVFKCSRKMAREADAGRWAERETYLRNQIQQALKKHNEDHQPKLQRGERRKQTNCFHRMLEKKKEMQVELVAKAREEKKSKQDITHKLKYDKAVKASVARELKKVAKNTAQSNKPKKSKLAKSSRTVKVPSDDFVGNAYQKVYGNKPSISRQTKAN